MQQLGREQRKERGSQVGRSGKAQGSEANKIIKGKKIEEEISGRRRKKKKN